MAATVAVLEETIRAAERALGAAYGTELSPFEIELRGNVVRLARGERVVTLPVEQAPRFLADWFRTLATSIAMLAMLDADNERSVFAECGCQSCGRLSRLHGAVTTDVRERVTAVADHHAPLIASAPIHVTN